MERYADVVSVITGEEDIVNDVAKLLTDLVGGELAHVGYHSSAAVSETIANVEAIVDNFVDNNVVDEAFAQLIALYEGVAIENIAEGTLAIAMDNLIASVAEVVKVAAVGNEHNVEHVAALVDYFVGGTIGEVALEDDLTIDATLELVKVIVLDYAAFVEVVVVFDELGIT